MSNFIQITSAARLHLRSKTDVIIFVVALVLYFGINIILQTVKPNMSQKKINTISLIAALVILVIGILVI